MSAKTNIIITVLLSVVFSLSAKAQSQALAPYEGSTHSYTWNGLQQGVDYEFYLTASNDGSGLYDDAQTSEFDFTTVASGTVASDESSASVNITWNTGAAANNYFLWIKVTDASGCSNYRYVTVSPVENGRSFMFDVLASTECFNPTDNSFALPFSVVDANGVALAQDCFPLAVEYSVNGTSHTATIAYSKQELSISESTMTTLSPLQNNEITVAVTGVTDAKGEPIPGLSKATHTRTIFALPAIEFTDAIRLKYNLLNNEELISYNSTDTDSGFIASAE